MRNEMCDTVTNIYPSRLRTGLRLQQPTGLSAVRRDRWGVISPNPDSRCEPLNLVGTRWNASLPRLKGGSGGLRPQHWTCIAVMNPGARTVSHGGIRRAQFKGIARTWLAVLRAGGFMGRW
jgi:hypothetical protein